MTHASTAVGTAAVTPQGAAVTPASAKGTTKASQKKGAPKAKTGAKTAAKTAPANRKETAAKQVKPAAKPRKQEARDGSKKGAVIELLRRKEGVTAAEIAKLTNWQPHTIRGFVSTISKKMKLAIESVRNEQGQRVYRVK
jgi:hypothetical protein